MIFITEPVLLLALLHLLYLYLLALLLVLLLLRPLVPRWSLSSPVSCRPVLLRLALLGAWAFPSLCAVRLVGLRGRSPVGSLPRSLAPLPSLSPSLLVAGSVRWWRWSRGRWVRLPLRLPLLPLPLPPCWPLGGGGRRRRLLLLRRPSGGRWFGGASLLGGAPLFLFRRRAAGRQARRQARQQARRAGQKKARCAGSGPHQSCFPGNTYNMVDPVTVPPLVWGRLGGGGLVVHRLKIEGR